MVERDDQQQSLCGCFPTVVSRTRARCPHEHDVPPALGEEVDEEGEAHRVHRRDRELREGRLAGPAADGQGHVLGHALGPGQEGEGLRVEVVVEALPILLGFVCVVMGRSMRDLQSQTN